MASSGGGTEVQTYETLSKLYENGDYEGMLQRAEKAAKGEEGKHPAVKAAMGAAMVQVGRHAEGLATVEEVLKGDRLPAAMVNDMKFLRAYALYGMHNLDDALQAVRDLIKGSRQPSAFAQHLEAQILSRKGDFAGAAASYRSMLEGSSRRGLRWLTARATDDDNVKKAEIVTNFCFNLVSGNSPDEAIALESQAPDAVGSEALFNIACAWIAKGDFTMANVVLKQAHEKAVEILEAEGAAEADMKDELAGLLTQMAYVRSRLGDEQGAETQYTDILKGEVSDIGVVAVASNNLTAARWEAPNRKNLTLSKRMKATTVAGVEHKLTEEQRKVFGINRLIIDVEMSKFDACREELERLRKSNQDDDMLRLVEASMHKAAGDAGKAEESVRKIEDLDEQCAALAQIRLDNGDLVGAGDALSQLGNSPAAIAAASVLYEGARRLDLACEVLRSSATDWKNADKKPLAVSALRELANQYMRSERFRDAIAALDELLALYPDDEAALALLVIAASNVDGAEAEKYAKRLPDLQGTEELDAAALEALVIPRKRDRAADTETRRKERTEENGRMKSDVVKIKKKKKKKTKKPAHLPPDAPPPDPERWLPKYMRSGYKKKRSRNVGLARGSQGAGLAATAAASERMTAAAATAGSNIQAGPSAVERPKGSRAKSKRKGKK
mmetsp:Transcript_3817/g.11357  ORF Transcript_3817/g.11357 Transcript_3817/m.11357 type:complete len:672 (-) Transcript_3817:176-2191(-)|eukprot:CAMPEP_0198737008 /NCGR_PEP_ID=MMETSP1475-20131203/67646_1 /TAXON_ID= ORGANISM="Unidentified sp., Strain CCMP1999" /NCGR_SAMPLE_ID=MMETSP1475 /ASSEMBLY_ACC=CAM_ASM_001111 /LENGTH=671 /DNA_ID=CAMNT_0044500863 /DNA_START=1 /DNA_END=2016 /DNA_ORIENTATION=-